MYINEPIVNKDPFSEAREQAFMFEDHVINKYGKEAYSTVLVLLLDRLFRSETERIMMLKEQILDSERLMEITLKNLEQIVPEA